MSNSRRRDITTIEEEGSIRLHSHRGSASIEEPINASPSLHAQGTAMARHWHGNILVAGYRNSNLGERRYEDSAGQSMTGSQQ